MLRFLLLASAALGLQGSAVAGDRLALCGQDEVFVMEVNPSDDASSSAPDPRPKKLWSWRAAVHPEIPEALHKTFATTDEIKWTAGGDRVLIASSSGGCALVEYPTGKALWHARVPNAHSIEALPGNLVVVASSVAKEGDRLVLFDLARSNAPLASTPLPSAHGVIWDSATQRLWALGFEELRRYALIQPTPNPSDPKPEAGAGAALQLEASFRWPGNDGHDLQAVPGTSDLLLSCGAGVWLFDRKTETFRPQPELGSIREVKSVSIHPQTGRLVWTQADGGNNWWTSEIHFLNPASKIILPDEKLYKVRWLPEAKSVAE